MEKVINYCLSCLTKGIKKEIIVNKHYPSDICLECEEKFTVDKTEEK